MCGIGAVINYGLTGNELFNLVKQLLLKLETRGKDATGIFMVFEDGSFILRKTWRSASIFVEYLVKIRDYIPWDKVLYVLLHCRSATSGSPMNNENNHPLYEVLDDDLVVVVHNGKIKKMMDDELNKLKKREVDSDYLLTGVRKYGRYDFDIVKRTIDRACGLIACIYANLKGLIMWYKTHRLPLAKLETDDFIILASTEEIIRNSIDVVKHRLSTRYKVEEVDSTTLFAFEYNKRKIIKKETVAPYSINACDSHHYHHHVV